MKTRIYAAPAVKGLKPSMFCLFHLEIVSFWIENKFEYELKLRVTLHKLWEV